MWQKNGLRIGKLVGEAGNKTTLSDLNWCWAELGIYFHLLWILSVLNILLSDSIFKYSSSSKICKLLLFIGYKAILETSIIIRQLNLPA